jgi:hypothetical protein
MIPLKDGRNEERNKECHFMTYLLGYMNFFIRECERNQNIMRLSDSVYIFPSTVTVLMMN